MEHEITLEATRSCKFFGTCKETMRRGLRGLHLSCDDASLRWGRHSFEVDHGSSRRPFFVNLEVNWVKVMNI